MLELLQSLRDRIPIPGREQDDEHEHEPAFAPLRAAAAQLLLVTGAGATLDSLAQTRRRQGAVAHRPLDYARTPTSTPYAALWGPSLVAPLAATAHLTHLARPSPATTRATRVLDAAVIGMGIAGLAHQLWSGRRERIPSIAPLALASAGLLGLLLDRQEHRALRERQRLERRAAVVERLVPRRRPKLDRVVVHV